MNRLKAIGFWEETCYGNKSNRFPNPKKLVGSKYSKEERNKIVEYLKSGKEISYWLGYSWCRFKCGISNEEMGCRDLTDGYWFWPQGLAHYIEVHNVVLPNEFVNYIKNNHYIVKPFDIHCFSQEQVGSFQFWLSWYSAYSSSLPWYKRLF